MTPKSISIFIPIDSCDEILEELRVKISEQYNSISQRQIGYVSDLDSIGLFSKFPLFVHSC